MAAKKKKTTRNKKKQPRPNKARFPWKGILFFFLVLAFIAAVPVSFFYLEKYVKNKPRISQRTGPLEIMTPPAWINNALLERTARQAGAKIFALNEHTAQTVAADMAQFAWMKDTRVRVTDKTVQLFGEYRLPVVMVETTGQKYYIAADMTVMDFVPLDTVNTVQVKGFAYHGRPALGSKWLDEDMELAVKLALVLDKMDELTCPDNPLLEEIEYIDITNHEGRKSSNKPHVVLNVTDGTEVFWGASYGQSQKYLEADEKEKVQKLYSFYKQHGTLAGKVKYIELRIPQKSIPRARID